MKRKAAKRGREPSPRFADGDPLDISPATYDEEYEPRPGRRARTDHVVDGPSRPRTQQSNAVARPSTISNGQRSTRRDPPRDGAQAQRPSTFDDTAMLDPQLSMQNTVRQPQQQNAYLHHQLPRAPPPGREPMHHNGPAPYATDPYWPPQPSDRAYNVGQQYQPQHQRPIRAQPAHYGLGAVDPNLLDPVGLQPTESFAHGSGRSQNGVSLRSASPPPQTYVDDQTEPSQVAEPTKSKKKAKQTAPRTNRACIHCRKQKMRCDGAEDPPCKRCTNLSLSCNFERRADYVMNKDDSRWQNRTDALIQGLTDTVAMLCRIVREQIPGALESLMDSTELPFVQAAREWQEDKGDRQVRASVTGKGEDPSQRIIAFESPSVPAHSHHAFDQTPTPSVHHQNGGSQQVFHMSPHYQINPMQQSGGHGAPNQKDMHEETSSLNVVPQNYHAPPDHLSMHRVADERERREEVNLPYRLPINISNPSHGEARALLTQSASHQGPVEGHHYPSHHLGLSMTHQQQPLVERSPQAVHAQNDNSQTALDVPISTDVIGDLSLGAEAIENTREPIDPYDIPWKELWEVFVCKHSGAGGGGKRAIPSGLSWDDEDPDAKNELIASIPGMVQVWVRHFPSLLHGAWTTSGPNGQPEIEKTTPFMHAMINLLAAYMHQSDRVRALHGSLMQVVETEFKQFKWMENGIPDATSRHDFDNLLAALIGTLWFQAPLGNFPFLGPRQLFILLKSPALLFAGDEFFTETNDEDVCEDDKPTPSQRYRLFLCLLLALFMFAQHTMIPAELTECAGMNYTKLLEIPKELKETMDVPLVIVLETYQTHWYRLVKSKKDLFEKLKGKAWWDRADDQLAYASEALSVQRKHLPDWHKANKTDVVWDFVGQGIQVMMDGLDMIVSCLALLRLKRVPQSEVETYAKDVYPPAAIDSCDSLYKIMSSAFVTFRSHVGKAPLILQRAPWMFCVAGILVIRALDHGLFHEEDLWMEKPGKRKEYGGVLENLSRLGMLVDDLNAAGLDQYHPISNTGVKLQHLLDDAHFLRSASFQNSQTATGDGSSQHNSRTRKTRSSRSRTLTRRKSGSSIPSPSKNVSMETLPRQPIYSSGPSHEMGHHQRRHSTELIPSGGSRRNRKVMPAMYAPDPTLSGIMNTPETGYTPSTPGETPSARRKPDKITSHSSPDPARVGLGIYADRGHVPAVVQNSCLEGRTPAVLRRNGKDPTPLYGIEEMRGNATLSGDPFALDAMLEVRRVDETIIPPPTTERTDHVVHVVAEASSSKVHENGATSNNSSIGRESTITTDAVDVPKATTTSDGAEPTPSTNADKGTREKGTSMNNTTARASSTTLDELLDAEILRECPQPDFMSDIDNLGKE